MLSKIQTLSCKISDSLETVPNKELYLIVQKNNICLNDSLKNTFRKIMFKNCLKLNHQLTTISNLPLEIPYAAFVCVTTS